MSSIFCMPRVPMKRFLLTTNDASAMIVGAKNASHLPFVPNVRFEKCVGVGRSHGGDQFTHGFVPLRGAVLPVVNYGLAPCFCFSASIIATSTIISSWPPTTLSLPSSTRISRASTPNCSAALSACSRKLE